MKNDFDSVLCNQIIRLAIENRPMPREKYPVELGLETSQAYTPVAIYSALTYLVTHDILSIHKNLVGLSNPQLTAASFWMKIDNILQHSEGAIYAATKGPI